MGEEGDRCVRANAMSSLLACQYLEFLVQFFLNPVGNVSQSDFSLSQFGSGLQFQVRWSPEAVPATEKVQTSSVAEPLTV